MRVVLDRSAFLKALAHSQSVVEKRTTIPVLSHVLLETEDDTLKLTATDLDLAIIEKVPAQNEKPGRTTVSAHILYDIVRKTKEDDEIYLSLSEKGDQLILEAGRSRFTLSTLNADDFPIISSGSLPQKFLIFASDLKKLIEGTRFAMSSEDPVYYLNGIYLHPVDGKELRAVATDGHRLAQMGIDIPVGAHNIPGVIISRKTVNELLKLIEENSEEIEVELSETQISFKFRDVFLTSRLVDGTFPDYQHVIPANNNKRMYIDINALAEAVDRVITVSHDKERCVNLSLSEGRLALAAKGNELGYANEELEVDYTFEPLDICFNARYILDVADRFEKNAEAEFHLAEMGDPVIVRDPQDPRALFLVMPTRV